MKKPAILLLLLGILCGSSTVAYGQRPVSWLNDLRQAREIAQRENKPILLHFWSQSCAPCLRLDTYVFPHPDVASAIETHFVPVKINVDRHPQLAKHYRIDRIPHDVFLAPDGRILQQQISPGKKDQYLQLVQHVAAGIPRRPANPQQMIASGRPHDVPVISRTDRGQFRSSPLPSHAPGTHTASGQPSGHVASRPPESRNQVTVSNPYVGSGGGRFAPPTQPASMSRSQPTPHPSQTHHAAGGNSPVQIGHNPAAPRHPSATTQPTQGAMGHPAQVAQHPGGNFQPATMSNYPGNSVQPKPQPTRASAAAPSSNTIPPVGMDGYCPVTLIQQRAWVKGNRSWGCVHRGRLYLFSNEQNRDQFFRAPDKYSPALSGYDPVHFADLNQLVPGRREHGVFLGDQIYLFADEKSLQQFGVDMSRYLQVIEESSKQQDRQRQQ